LKKLIILTLALLISACEKSSEDTTNQIETASSDDTSASNYAGDCVTANAELVKIDTVDRDQWGSAGLDLEAMDQRFSPGDNFFCYVNGTWYNNFEMPEDKTRYGSFTLLRDKSENRVKAIIEELAGAKPD